MKRKTEATQNREAVLALKGSASRRAGLADGGCNTASARLRRIADKIEIVERTKAVVEKLALAMPESAADAEDRAHLVECETMLRFLAGEPITGAQYNDLRDCEVTNFLGGYHLEPLAETHPADAVVAWEFEDMTVACLLLSACRVLSLAVMPEVQAAVPPDCARDMARLRRLIAKYAPRP